MGKKKNRRKFTVEQKAAILRRHLAEKVPVSDLCDEYRLQATGSFGRFPERQRHTHVQFAHVRNIVHE